MTGQQIGYIRVSSVDQHPERQLDGIALDQSFIDKASGKDVARPQPKLATTSWVFVIFGERGMGLLPAMVGPGSRMTCDVPGANTRA